MSVDPWTALAREHRKRDARHIAWLRVLIVAGFILALVGILAAG